MRIAWFVLVGATSFVVVGCGGEAGKVAPEEEGGEVGVSTSELTNCVRTELVNLTVFVDGPGYACWFRLMENNFVCDEGVVGQASTELVNGGIGNTATAVATKLFDQMYDSWPTSSWHSPATIATQWGHVFASSHLTLCKNAQDVMRFDWWDVDPFTKTAKRQ